ncbi:hypothetical protein [Methanoculleus chikugoensis]|uniref:hypothetical protein n=1 Tax=Methanoculleus chikugoensis TaxID=118126 RepID=UPI001FB43640|nr:hypothetical protein [Methanoculleus chikugoensis]
MAIPMLAFFSAGGVVDAVAGHGDDLPVAGEDIDHPEFVLRGDPGEHLRRPEAFFEFIVGHRLEIRPPGHRPPSLDRPRSRAMVEAVSGLSPPVIMMTSIPALRQSRIASAASGRGGGRRSRQARGRRDRSPRYRPSTRCRRGSGRQAAPPSTRSPPCDAYLSISARSASRSSSVSGTTEPPRKTRDERARRTSGAPLHVGDVPPPPSR